MILLFLFLRLLPFKGLFIFLPFYSFTFLPFKGLFTFKKQEVHGGFYSYINQ